MTTPVDQQPAESGVRARTRAAVVDAALGVWARDWSASLADVAAAAAVSRSTLHRYFPDRQALVEAARDRAVSALDTSARTALRGVTAPADQLDVLMRAMVDAGDAILFLFSDPHRFTELWQEGVDEHAELREIVEQAQAEGMLVDDVHPDWVISMFYSVVYVAAESVNTGVLPRHRAGDVSVRGFFGGVGVPDAD